MLHSAPHDYRPWYSSRRLPMLKTLITHSSLPQIHLYAAPLGPCFHFLTPLTFALTTTNFLSVVL